jgi:hypothetical protein
MSEETQERILTQPEVAELLQTLQIKYGAELETIQRQIESDMKCFGYVTFATKKAQLDLSNRILDEKNHEH